MKDWREGALEQPPAADRVTWRIAALVLRSAWVSAALAAVLQGCDRAPSPAGVVSLFHDPSVPTWRVDARPELQLGGADEREGYILDDVRGAVLLGDRLAVADRASREIRFYTLDGALVARSGRRGNGPGEYQQIAAIAPYGDTAVAVWDFLLSRITIVGRGGKVVRTVEPELSGARDRSVHFVGALRQGQLVFAGRVSTMALRDAEPGPRRDSVTVLILDADGRWNGVVLKQRGAETWLFKESGRWSDEELLFGRSAFQVVAGGALVLATNDSLEFSRVDGDGAVVATAVLPWTPRPVTRAAVEAERAALRKEAEARRKSYAFVLVNGQPFGEYMAPFERRVIERLPASGSWPAFGEMRGDGAGRIWVGEYLGRASTATERTWLVLDPAFRPVGRVMLPSSLRVLAVGADRLVGWTTDGWGREVVSVYRITR